MEATTTNLSLITSTETQKENKGVLAKLAQPLQTVPGVGCPALLEAAQSCCDAVAAALQSGAPVSQRFHF